jgi:hypothetical protein
MPAIGVPHIHRGHGPLLHALDTSQGGPCPPLTRTKPAPTGDPSLSIKLLTASPVEPGFGLHSDECGAKTLLYNAADTESWNLPGRAGSRGESNGLRRH